MSGRSGQGSVGEYKSRYDQLVKSDKHKDITKSIEPPQSHMKRP